MELGELFARTMDDLDRRSWSADQYELVGLAALLRKLLLDGTPLVDAVNREHRLRLRFIISDYVEPELESGLVYRGTASQTGLLDPGDIPAGPTLEVDRSTLLSRTVLFWRGRLFTVRDLIVHFANKRGGVHWSSELDQDDSFLLQADTIMRIGDGAGTEGLSPALIELRGLARVVSRALEPLLALIRPEHDSAE